VAFEKALDRAFEKGGPCAVQRLDPLLESLRVNP
jgi:hypothetical protein